MIKPIQDSIIFQFLNKRSSNMGMFEETTASGIALFANNEDSSKMARWAIANFIGPEVKEINQGDYILIEPLQWTEAIKYNNEEWWKTDESKILCVSKEKPSIGY